MADLTSLLSHVDASYDGAVERLCELLRIPSIGTDPAYDGETRRAGQWLADDLARLGFDSQLRESQGHPMVVAHHLGPGGDAPHLLYYGHYDVQPAEPLELWRNPPFEPAIEDGPRGKRLVARGAVDDKGQLMTFIEAFRVWIEATGSLPCKVTVFLEGEEESGSPSLVPFLRAHKDELAADAVVISDTPGWNADTPAVATFLRGMLYTEATVHGPNQDLHSGLYGGAVTNPINALTRVLGQLHDARGRVQIPGFYDKVRAIPEETRRQWRELGFDAGGFLAQIGVSEAFGEDGTDTLERIWARPTCDINGIYGGYTGAGSKTVLPSQASAKVSFRLVADQDPDEVFAGYERFLRERLGPGASVELQRMTSVPAVQTPPDSRYVQAALAAMGRVYGKDATKVGMGGTIPVVLRVREQLGLESVLMGFGLTDDGPHAPNEKFELACFRRGIQSHVAFLGQLGGAI